MKSIKMFCSYSSQQRVTQALYFGLSLLFQKEKERSKADELDLQFCCGQDFTCAVFKL
ncbi:hypothetical protein WN944_019896 [Citrus x changshan-huyou]|uniref:Uncharacterized protein n=1 Tax=Citrus x changshan-huyou TaxID=2935761 RepID=A0AAP0QGB4_9ROSI